MRGIETPERSERREPRHAPEIVDGPETVADRQPRRRRWRIGIAIAVAFCVAGLLAYWQIHAFRAAFNTLIPYAPSVLPAVVAGFAIRFKDWNNYRPIHIRWVLILIVFLSMLGGIIYQNHQRSERAAADARTAAAQQAQVDNTALFLIRLNDLSSKMTKLETDAMSEKFKKDLDSVRAELKQTQDHLLHTQAELMKANTPKPKARLAFSFFNFPSPLPLGKFISDPVTSITVPVKADGSVHVDLTLINATEVTAVDGDITITLCKACKFAKEPEGFIKLTGAPDTERFRRFDRLHPMTVFSPIGVYVEVPDHLPFFNIGLKHRCETCALVPGASSGTVYLDKSMSQK